jgi:ubiquinone/menaquinone biosynthesis C-methylase UbiE
MTDPKAQAIARFAGADALKMLSAMDIILSNATDPPRIIELLLAAGRPGATPGARICELGFGTPGWLLDELKRAFPETRLHGLDLSLPFARHAQELHGADVRIIRGDMERLPFRDAAFDVIYTCWTLYFMRDIDAALAEIRRIIARGGRLIAATNAPDHMQEYVDLAAAALRTTAGREQVPDMADTFTADNGRAYFERHFAHVDRVMFDGEMVLRDPEHVLPLWDAYAESPPLTGAERDRVMKEMRNLSNQRIQRDGAVRLRRHGGIFIGTA